MERAIIARVLANLSGAVAACFGLSLAAPTASLAIVPVPGTIITTEFCGIVFEATVGMENHGVTIDDPYIGKLKTIQRDWDEKPSAQSAQWDCTALSPCGEYRLILQEFTPPQTSPVLQDIFGPISEIDQDIQTYRLGAIVDDFVEGPADLSATGMVDFEVFCTDCGEVNDFENIAPNFKDFFGNISGNGVLLMQVPGIGGSLAPPEGNTQTIRMSISRLGGACNNILPATSSWGLVGLVGLMVLTSLLFAGKRPTA
jgi:hypothetical protein